MISAQIFSLFWLKKPLKLNSGKPALSTETKVLKIWLPLMISSASKVCPKRIIWFNFNSNQSWYTLNLTVSPFCPSVNQTLLNTHIIHITLTYVKHIKSVLLSLSAPLLAVHSKPLRRPSRLVSGRKPSTSWSYRKIYQQWNTTWRSLSTTPPCRTLRWERRDEEWKELNRVEKRERRRNIKGRRGS